MRNETIQHSSALIAAIQQNTCKHTSKQYSPITARIIHPQPYIRAKHSPAQAYATTDTRPCANICTYRNCVRDTCTETRQYASMCSHDPCYLMPALIKHSCVCTTFVCVPHCSLATQHSCAHAVNTNKYASKAMTCVCTPHGFSKRA